MIHNYNAIYADDGFSLQCFIVAAKDLDYEGDKKSDGLNDPTKRDV